ncbi:MAG: two-component sensor histidine kinase [Burkholderiales bacterium PBB1]|nr:MAG: two-component sensor histidine kinase [Burkholderiales bacterium PBB1]
MFSLDRFSFHQLLLVAFLLIAGLLSAASLRGLFTIEALITQSSDGAKQAVSLGAAAQRLSERSVAMERAARQYLVLDDPLLRQRFDEAAHEAGDALDQLAAGTGDVKARGGGPSLATSWQGTLQTIRQQLSGDAETLRDREQALTAAFRDLGQLNIELADQVRLATESRNAALLERLESGRAALARQIVAAIAIAVGLALAFGIWLARPLKRLETAIVGLGENRLDQAIDMRGPADVRQLGRRLEWLRLRLAELDADKARFLRHVSHELKTPLAALREGVALLEDGVTGTLNDPQREVARILRQNTAVLQGQIEDLLRFNTAAFDARRLVRRPVELTTLIAEQIESQKLQWQARKLKVSVTGWPIQAEVDAEKLGTALGNLLSNAIRFSPIGGRIVFTVSQWPGRARIDVTDEGPGVAAVDRARVFEPFFRGERQPTDAPRGSGIGLSIVQELVRAHDGQIDLLMPDENSPSGAHFRIELPHVPVR